MAFFFITIILKADTTKSKSEIRKLLLKDF